MDRHNGSRQPDGHVPALDGVRGLAIALVLLFHAGLPMPSSEKITFITIKLWLWGLFGVDLFFVLSGFLITGILVDSREAPHYFRNFYLRRALRIFPLYYGTVALLLVLPSFLFLPGEHDQLWQSQGWLWLHVSNWFTVRHGGFLLCGANHFWSLAVEEQFYLVWPLIVYLCPRRALPAVSLAILLAAWAGREVLVLTGGSISTLYVLTFTRLDAFAIGGLVALLVRQAGGAARLARWSGPTAVGAALVLLVLALERPTFPQWTDPFTQAVGFPLVTVLFGAFLARCAVSGPADRLHRVLSVAPLRWLGKYSYAIYVFHFPLLYQAGCWLIPRGVPRLLACYLAVAVALVLAWLSWHGFEKHFLKLKRLFPRETPRSAVDAPGGLAA